MKYLLRRITRRILEDEGELPFRIYNHEKWIGNFIIANSAIYYGRIFANNDTIHI